MDAASAKGIQYRPEMDGLRGLACLLVLVGHSIEMTIPASADVMRGIPKIGVWLFFSLSAFLLTLRLLETGISLRSITLYAYARALRIIPLFTIATIFYLKFGTLDINTVQDAVAVLTFQRGSGHLWTIPVEMGFYVVLPFILAICTLCTFRLRIFIIAAISAAAFILWPAWKTEENSIFTGWYLVAFMPSIIAAMAVQGGGIKTSGWLAGSSLAIAVIYAVAIKSGLTGNAVTGLSDKFYIFGLIFAVTVGSIYTTDGAWKTIFAFRPLVMVGEASFSIYLFHWAICYWIAGSFKTLPAIALAITASIIVGVIICRYVEMPLYALRRMSLSLKAI